MRNFTLYLTGFLCLFLTKIFAQETFESRTKAIASKIENITKEEKTALKSEIEEINNQLQNQTITREQADDKKIKLAEERAKNIEFKVAQVQQELKDLVQQKVDGKIKESDSSKTITFRFDRFDSKKHSKSKNIDYEKRTTSQFVFAFGVNNLVTNKSVANSDYRYWGSHFFEWGVTANTRIFKNNNLLHAKYGLSVMYNNLRPTDNRFFTETGNQTNLVTSSLHLEDSRFRNVYLVAPLHLEFDFSKRAQGSGKYFFRTHQSFRVGLGGYLGANIKSKQILFYENANGNDVKERIKGDYNVNDFVYGASAYIGYKAISLYAKYDLSSIFKDNVVDQNNVSFGLRFDIN